MSCSTEFIVREFETAQRVRCELGSAADEAYELAFLELAGYALDGRGLTAEQTQRIYKLFQSYEAKRDGMLEAQGRKAQALQRLLIELKHPIELGTLL